ncbi:MAG: hypothetical protein JNG90_11645 [Planctomycetaceae bacterium]|nr:hypothetical protein [Planctomycetaceae bacterium]
MKRPRFALSIMLGAMAASIAALGFPPVSNSPAAVGGAPNAALICPASSLAAESHPFHWFERAESSQPDIAVDNWLLTVRAPVDSAEAAVARTEAAEMVAAVDEPTSAAQVVMDCRSAWGWDCGADAAAAVGESERPAMRLEDCDLSIAECLEEYEAAKRVALEFTGLAWIEEAGSDRDFRLDVPASRRADVSDASALAADYRHSTGLADVLRINIREGRPPRVIRPLEPVASAVPAQVEDVSFEDSLADDLVLTAIATSADAYQKFYRLQQSADDVAGLLREVARNVTAGMSDLLEFASAAQSAQARVAEAPAPAGEVEEAKPAAVRTISVVRPAEADIAADGFELVSDDGHRYVYVRAVPLFAGSAPAPTVSAQVEPSVTNSFELVIDGPDRFLFLRKEGFKETTAVAPVVSEAAPAFPGASADEAAAANLAGHSMAVLLPRPLPPAATVGIDADWLAWDYFRFQVDRALQLQNCATSSPGDSLDCDDFAAAESWDCLAAARHQDTLREQIAAEEAASDGAGDAIQSVIREQAASEGAPLPATGLPGEIAPLSAPLGCHGVDPVGCLTHRAQIRNERFAHSAAWSLHKLAALLESCADELRRAAGLAPTDGAPEPSGVDPTGPASASGDLTPTEPRTASQRFLSELYLGL